LGYLPSGVLLSRDGLISGTPQIGGTYDVTITTSCDEFPATMYVVDPTPFRVRFGGFYAAVRGVQYTYELRSTEGGLLKWTMVGGRLPAGVVVKENGFVFGVPRATGRFRFRVQVDDGRRTAARSFTLRVVRRLTLLTTRVPAAHVNRRFRVPLRLRGGVQPYFWNVLSGKTPRGIRFAYGVFSGTPRVAGRTSITVQVRDHQGWRSVRTYALRVER
jgi:hypothetical protein